MSLLPQACGNPWNQREQMVPNEQGEIKDCATFLHGGYSFKQHWHWPNPGRDGNGLPSAESESSNSFLLSCCWLTL